MYHIPLTVTQACSLYLLFVLQETTIDTSGNLPEMLHKLAMEQKFIDKYILIEQKSMKGKIILNICYAA